MPLIKCVKPYSTQSEEWAVGKEDTVSSERAEFLLRDSPGSFVLIGQEDGSPANPDVDLGAMSTETQTGLVAPDRRARGGRRR